MAPVPKLPQHQTFKYHEKCGQHSLTLGSTVNTDYANVPTLSLVHGFSKVVNNIDISTMTLGLTTVMACTGECALQPIAVPSHMRVDALKMFCMTMFAVLQRSAIIHDTVKDFVDNAEATSMNGGNPTLDSIKAGLSTLDYELNSLE